MDLNNPTIFCCVCLREYLHLCECVHTFESTCAMVCMCVCRCTFKSTYGVVCVCADIHLRVLGQGVGVGGQLEGTGFLS